MRRARRRREEDSGEELVEGALLALSEEEIDAVSTASLKKGVDQTSGKVHPIISCSRC